jgi:DNA-binding response OmpR family regulator
MMSEVTKRALVIFKDDLDGRDVFYLLNYIGFSVDIAHSGLEALRMFQRRRYDLIVTELVLDGISGLGLFTCAKKNPETITIGVNNGSETGSETLRRVATEFGIDIILDLPLDIKSFSTILNERLNK